MMTYIGDIPKEDLLRLLWEAAPFVHFYEGDRRYKPEIARAAIEAGFIHVFCGKYIAMDLRKDYVNPKDYDMYNKGKGLFDAIVYENYPMA